MKRWMRRALVGLFGAGVLFGGLAACSHRDHGMGAGRSESERAEWRARMVERAGSRLDLDAAQKARLATLADTLAAQRKAVMGDITDPRAELKAMIAGERFDRSRAQSLVDGKTAALREASPAVITAAADFYDSLKPTQQQQLRDMLARGKRWGRG
jgi:Spy/CpxP family protein refolding chaperone